MNTLETRRVIRSLGRILKAKGGHVNITGRLTVNDGRGLLYIQADNRFKFANAYRGDDEPVEDGVGSWSLFDSADVEVASGDLLRRGTSYLGYLAAADAANLREMARYTLEFDLLGTNCNTSRRVPLYAVYDDDD